jgi:hypothetical protein
MQHHGDKMENPYSAPLASVDSRPRTRRSKESGNENYFKTARAHLVLAGLSLFAVAGLLLVAFASPRSFQLASTLLVLGILLASAGVHLLVWWGAKRRFGWARVLSIVLGLFSLPGFPVGTVIGVYLIAIAIRKWQEPEYYELISLEGWPGQAPGKPGGA